MPGCGAGDERKLNTEADKNPNHKYRDKEFEGSKTSQRPIWSIKQENEKCIGYS
jgi:hypothetical protein